MEDKPQTITEATLTMANLSEYVYNAVGEASTLFYRNKEHIFDEKSAQELSERLIKGITKLVTQATEEGS